MQTLVFVCLLVAVAALFIVGLCIVLTLPGRPLVPLALSLLLAACIFGYLLVTSGERSDVHRLFGVWTIGLGSIWITYAFCHRAHVRSILATCIGVLVILWLLGGQLLYGGYYQRIKVRELQVFAESIPRYVAYLNQFPEVNRSDAVSIKGKVLVVEITKYDDGAMFSRGRPTLNDEIHYMLPATLRASTPDDVGTVVILTWDRRDVGKYTDGASAYVHVAEVGVVYLSDKTKVQVAQTFQGGQPPDEKSWRGPAYGSLPYEQIVHYIVRAKKVSGTNGTVVSVTCFVASGKETRAVMVTGA